MKVGFVNIFGRPNAGKSTLLNALIGEKLAIVSPKVQTTRHRIKGILNEKDYQVVFSDTPGIIDPKYKLHEKMMMAVKTALEDADLALLLVDIRGDWQADDDVFSTLKLKVPAVILLTKIDLANEKTIQQATEFFSGKPYCRKIIPVSALSGSSVNSLINELLVFLPEGEPFFEGDEITDLPTKFLVGELVREKIYEFTEEELPYHTTVLVREFKEKTTLVKIMADIIVQRETQKAILIGEKGSMIKKIGTEARKSIEAFLQRKVFLELFVKVRPKWRDSDLYLKEYGYH